MTTATAQALQKTAIRTGGAQTDWTNARLEKLIADALQFFGALPDPGVVEAKRQPGLWLPQVVQAIFEGYGPRSAIGHRAKEFVADLKPVGLLQ